MITTPLETSILTIITKIQKSLSNNIWMESLWIYEGKRKFLWEELHLYQELNDVLAGALELSSAEPELCSPVYWEKAYSGVLKTCTCLSLIMFVHQEHISFNWRDYLLQIVRTHVSIIYKYLIYNFNSTEHSMWLQSLLSGKQGQAKHTRQYKVKQCKEYSHILLTLRGLL